MKIVDVRTVVTNPGGWNFVLVKITTDDGAYGWGDASLAGLTRSVEATIGEHFAPLLVGRDPSQIEDIWQTLYRSGYWKGGPVLMSAIAGVDMALWDLKGKVADLPVYQLLGGRCREGAMVYTHAAGRDASEVADQIRAAVDRGFKVVRAQVSLPGLRNTYGTAGDEEGIAAAALGGWDPHELPVMALETFDPDLYLRTVPRFFDELRDEVGFDVGLCHDTHQRLGPIEACRLAKDLEPHRLFFLEDLLAPERPESFRLVRNASTTPLAMGELYTDKTQTLTVVTEQLIDYVRCDLAHSGGITEARKIAAIAEPYGVKTAWHGPADIAPITHAANIHVDIAVPNFGIQEWAPHSDPVWEVFRGGPQYRAGVLDVDDTPGLGVDVDEDAAARYPYLPVSLPMTRRPDGSVHDW